MKTLVIIQRSFLRIQNRVRCFSTSREQFKSLPELTANRYPHLNRGQFASLSHDDINTFKQILGEESSVLTDDEEIHGYNTDWMGIVRGQSKCVLRPKTTVEVSSILKYCYDRNLAVCPQGGNTGLVGGSVPVFDEVIVSTQRMNKINSLDQVSGILSCQAGCVLEVLDNYVGQHNLMMPIDLGAKGSCHIGGNVATNAGGIRLLRYGSLHGSVLGVEAVLANGDIIDCLSTLRKDNTGYDIKQLFIGSEGTLGIVTAVSILCPQRPSSQIIALLACDSFDQVLSTLSLAKRNLSEVLSAYEFLDHQSMSCVCDNLKRTNPLASSPFYIVVEVSGSNAAHDEEKLSGFVDKAFELGLINDGTMASEPSKIKAIWQLRESVAEGLLYDGYCYKYDISLPLDRYYRLVEDMRHRLDGLATRVCGYGHVGDGNLHFNVTSKEYNQELRNEIEPYIYDYTSQCKGSISAEHGLGLLKSKYIYHSKSKMAVEVMRSIKKQLDPKGIMNPYKTIPMDENIVKL